jgi:hypothetical protein
MSMPHSFFVTHAPQAGIFVKATTKFLQNKLLAFFFCHITCTVSVFTDAFTFRECFTCSHFIHENSTLVSYMFYFLVLIMFCNLTALPSNIILWHACVLLSGTCCCSLLWYKSTLFMYCFLYEHVFSKYCTPLMVLSEC